MKISHEEIKHVAQLARLELSSSEIENMAGQLDRILGYVDKLSAIDTTGITPTTHALLINNAFRDDIVTESLPQVEALKNGPQQNGEAFIVPKVI